MLSPKYPSKSLNTKKKKEICVIFIMLICDEIVYDSYVYMYICKELVNFTVVIVFDQEKERTRRVQIDGFCIVYGYFLR